MKDLTKGNSFKLIILFALPVFAGCVFQQLYSMVDTVIVGNTINVDALTGVGLTGPVSFLVLGFANGLASGFGVRVAQRFGAGDEEGVRRAIAMSFTLCIIISALLTAVAVPLTGAFLRLMQTPDVYFDYAYWYLFTIFCGIGATMFYNVLAAVLRAVGDSATPLIFLIVCVALNVGLDFAFIVGLKMHYIGAALATVLSNLLSAVACFFYMFRRYPRLRPARADFRFDLRLAGGHIAVGLPMALQFSITAIGCIVQQTALNGLDASFRGVATAYAASSKIDNLVNQAFPALGTAMANYAGQNSGAGKFDRVRKGVNVSMLYVLCASAFGLGLCAGLYEPLMNLFIDTEGGGETLLYYDDILSYGRDYLLWQSACYLLLGAVFVYRNTLQGIGKSAVTTLAGVTELGGRVLASFVFVRFWGFTGICASNPAAWLAADVFLLVTYYVVMRGKGRRERKKKLGAPLAQPVRG